MNLDGRDLSVLEARIGYRFRNRELLKTALRHKSALEGKDGACNDRLEWLGDAVVGLFIADYLYRTHDKPRSWLSLVKSKWASEECLAQVAKKINLESFLELGKGEEKCGGRQKDSIISSALEALIGAIFLDSNSYEVTRNILERILGSEEGMEFLLLSVNYKSLLQRWSLQYLGILPEYHLIEGKNGTYRVGVKIQESFISYGEGKSKKKAEQDAAKNAWEKLIGERHLFE
ncbi:MAG: ribonuclease [Candidatus Atribacteria bacterium]|nr:ribonuclease [Candidatus Atribacteria bacterium]